MFYRYDILQKIFSTWKPSMANIVFKKNFQVEIKKKNVIKSCCATDSKYFVSQIELHQAR